MGRSVRLVLWQCPWIRAGGGWQGCRGEEGAGRSTVASHGSVCVVAALLLRSCCLRVLAAAHGAPCWTLTREEGAGS